jgi:hypothetical protein
MIELRIDEPIACGLGEGETCCAFLALRGREGFLCGRTVPGIERLIRARLAFGTMVARADPGDTPYPECQKARAVR